MSKSNIEWTQDTWNPIVGCSILSSGCKHCYAMGMAARIEAINAEARASGKPHAPQYDGTTKKVNGHAVWTGKLAMAGDNILLQPLKRKKPTTYFVNSMGDLFHEDVPDEWIDKVFAVMALAPQHTYQVLTKRAKRMREYMQRRMLIICDAMGSLIEEKKLNKQFLDQSNPDHWADGNAKCAQFPWPLSNVWLGVSTERQQEADERIPLLLQTPAAIRFISAEPLLGPINLTSFNHRGVVGGHSALHDRGLGKLDWVIVGGESGPGARPMHVGWARQLRVQCESAGVPFFFKQFGEWHPWTRGDGSGIAEHCIAWNGDISRGDELKGGGDRPRWIAIERLGKKSAGRSLDGIEYNEMPEAR